MTPPLASRQELAARLPGGIDVTDEARADAVLADASALVRAEAGVQWLAGDGTLGDVPDVIVTITLAAAKRAFVNPEGLESVAIDSSSARFRDVYLTRPERRLVRQAGGKSGLWAQPTTRTDPPDTPDVPSVFVGTRYSGDGRPGAPIPWQPRDSA